MHHDHDLPDMIRHNTTTPGGRSVVISLEMLNPKTHPYPDPVYIVEEVIPVLSEPETPKFRPEPIEFRRLAPGTLPPYRTQVVIKMKVSPSQHLAKETHKRVYFVAELIPFVDGFGKEHPKLFIVKDGKWANQTTIQLAHVEAWMPLH